MIEAPLAQDDRALLKFEDDEWRDVRKSHPMYGWLEYLQPDTLKAIEADLQCKRGRRFADAILEEIRYALDR